MLIPNDKLNHNLKIGQPLTSMSLQLLPGKDVVAGTIGLLVGGAVGLEQCWGTLGETGSILTMAGAEPKQTDWDRTTIGGREREREGNYFWNTTHYRVSDQWATCSSLLCEMVHRWIVVSYHFSLNKLKTQWNKKCLFHTISLFPVSYCAPMTKFQSLFPPVQKKKIVLASSCTSGQDKNSNQ